MEQTMDLTVPRTRHCMQQRITSHSRPPWFGPTCMLLTILNVQELAADPGNSTTDYNLVMGVLSTFFLITKLPTHWMKLFYPPVAVAVHGSLVILYIVSAAYQAGSDTSDPRHPQPGAPWYIAKSCSVASKKSNIPYCMQAKALFAVTILMMLVRPGPP